jgi:hypothetical protein
MKPRAPRAPAACHPLSGRSTCADEAVPMRVDVVRVHAGAALLRLGPDPAFQEDP